MKRGEIWTTAGGPAYAGKPRPVVVLQNDIFAGLDSATICLFTSNAANAPLFRLKVTASADNGLREISYLMADKVTTVPTVRLGVRLGALEDAYLRALERAILLFLGIAR